ncbi:hypothetical protein [Pseudomonas alabamensis]|uniref:hypothetical protein n=1 Tax=Pseudomonas alabamensis TaxID=3064349 RepID=UPI0011A3D4D1
MKPTDRFDTPSSRAKGPGGRGAQLAAGLSAMIATLGILMAMAGVAGLLGNYEAFAELNANRPLASVLVVAGLLLLWLGVRGWRLSRLRLRRRHELGLSPHLTKKRG